MLAKAGVVLPENIKWVTNKDYPEFVDPKAKRGGTLLDSISTYPLTFRLYGPNANAGGFVSYKRRWAFWGLTALHPNTREFMPELATHWAVMPDSKTVYYKLDPAARWSDGKPITADDYLFAFEFYKSKHIQAPYYNQYFDDHYESLDKIDAHTIRIVAKKPSWRILFEMDVTPLPRHAIKLDENWVKKYNWKPNVVPGPYALKKVKRGKYLEFHRVKNWWGDQKKRYQGRFNFDKVRLNIVRTTEIEFELFKKGRQNIYGVGDITRWMKQTEFASIQKGYIHKQQIFIQSPTGVNGIFLNVQDPLLKEKKVRQALMHLFNFKMINKKLLYNLSIRLHNFFDVFPPYRNPIQKAWPYDLRLSNRLLDEAGWTGARTNEGIRTKNGQPLQITVSIGTKDWTKYLAVMRESALKAGIDLRVKILDGAALFKAWGEKSHQATVLRFGGSAFPSPRQFLHTDNIKKNTNNMSQFGTAEIDRLIEIYEYNLDEKKRIEAVFQIEQIVKESAIVLPFWKYDHTRLLWWRHIKGPKGFVTKYGLDIDLLWFDQKEAQKLKSYQKSDESFPRLPNVVDPFKLTP